MDALPDSTNDEVMPPLHFQCFQLGAPARKGNLLPANGGLTELQEMTLKNIVQSSTTSHK